MLLPFDYFEGKGVLQFVASKDYYTNVSVSSSDPYLWDSEGRLLEPTSVLDNICSPNPPTTSSSTLSSSHGYDGRSGGCGTADTAEVAAVSGNPSSKCPPEANESGGVISELQVAHDTGGGEDGHGAAAVGPDKCGLGMEEWQSVLSDSAAASLGQEQSILRWIMGDTEDPALGLNKVLQIDGGGGGGGAMAEFGFNGGFGVMDQTFGLDSVVSSAGHVMPPTNISKFPNPQNPIFSPLSNSLEPISMNQQQQGPFESSDMKPQIFNPQVLINQHPSQLSQTAAHFLPVSYSTNQEPYPFRPPQSKRQKSGNLESNSQIPKGPFLDSGQELFRPFQGIPHFQESPSMVAARPEMAWDKLGHHQQQQTIINQIYEVSELILSGNPKLAQGILARLNQQLSPIGKPFQRAAYYCKEALQLLLQANNNNMNNPAMASNSPFSLIFKIDAYKSFSEISPFLQFANFTCNQALLEVLDRYDQIHIIDFDIGYGDQWASLMQELALKNGGAPPLKITAFASPSTHDHLHLGLTRENLYHFASELNIAFEFEIVSLDVLNSASWSLPIYVSESEAIAVNLPVGSFFSYEVSLPLVLRFIKKLSPKIIVSVDRGCDRTDLPFPNHVIYALQSYSNLLESLDAVNVNQDALQKIERFLLQPGIEKIVMGRYRAPETMQHWRTQLLSSGFLPLTFSNFTECQAEFVVKRTAVQGFHVENRQSSLVLCWQRRELISASAWRC